MQLQALLKSYPLVIIAISILMVEHVTAQKNIEWGDDLTLERRMEIEQFVGARDSSIFMLQTRSESFQGPPVNYLVRYSLDKLRPHVPIPLLTPSLEYEEVDFEGIMQLKEGFVVITSSYDRKEGIYQCFAHAMNDSGDFKGPPVLLEKIEELDRRKKGAFEFSLSPDSSKILLIYHYPFEKDEPEKVKLRTLSASLETIWSNTLELPYKDNEISIRNQLIDKNGLVYLLVNVTLTKSNRSNKSPLSKHLIFAYDHETLAIKEFEIRIPGKSVANSIMDLDKQNNLVATGFFTEGFDDESNASGLFFLRIRGSSLKINGRLIVNFDNDFMSEFLTDQELKRASGLEYFVPREILYRSDGGYYFVAEQHYVRQECIPDSRTGIVTCNDHFIYNDLMVLSISSRGDLLWTKAVKKRQFSIDDQGRYSSAVSHLCEDDLFLFFNDNEKNLNLDENQSLRFMSNPRKSVIKKVWINSEGKIYNKHLSPKQRVLPFFPQLHFSQQNCSSIILQRYGKDYRLGVVNLHAE